LHFGTYLTNFGDATIARACNDTRAKGGFSFRLKSKLDVWMRSFNETQIMSAEKFLSCVRYIDENPVRRGLVLAPDAFQFSSAGREGPDLMRERGKRIEPNSKGIPGLGIEDWGTRHQPPRRGPRASPFYDGLKPNVLQFADPCLQRINTRRRRCSIRTSPHKERSRGSTNQLGPVFSRSLVVFIFVHQLAVQANNPSLDVALRNNAGYLLCGTDRVDIFSRSF